MVLLVVPLVFRVPSGPAAREIATREPTARSGRSRSPPVPSVPSGALRTGGACVAVTSPARPCRRPRAPQPGPPCPPAPSTPAALVSLCVAGCVVSKPGQALPPPTGPAAWHRNPLVLSAPSIPAALVSLCVAGRVVSKRARALRALWHPPHRRRLCRCVWLGASSRSPARPRRRPRAPQSTGSTAWPSRSCGALHTGRANPLRVAVRSRFEVVSCPKCRPPRRKTLKTGCYGRSGLRFGRIGTCHSALLAREPAIASGNPLCRT